MIGIKFIDPELEKAIRDEANRSGHKIVNLIVQILMEHFGLKKPENKKRKAAAGR